MFSRTLTGRTRIITPQARFNAAYINIGLGGADLASSYFLPRLIGAGRAYEFMLTGDFLSAREAMDLGMVSRLVSPNELQDTAMTLAREGISWLTGQISELGCRVFDTHTNFFLVDVGFDCRKLYEKMLQKGVIIRPMAAYGYPQYIRITVGLPEENSRLVASLGEVLADPRSS